MLHKATEFLLPSVAPLNNNTPGELGHLVAHTRLTTRDTYLKGNYLINIIVSRPAANNIAAVTGAFAVGRFRFQVGNFRACKINRTINIEFPRPCTTIFRKLHADTASIPTPD